MAATIKVEKVGDVRVLRVGEGMDARTIAVFVSESGADEFAALLQAKDEHVTNDAAPPRDFVVISPVTGRPLTKEDWGRIFADADAWHAAQPKAEAAGAKYASL